MLLVLVLLCLLVVMVQRMRRPVKDPSVDFTADECDIDRPGTHNPLYHDGATELLAQLAANSRFDQSRASAASLQWELEAADAELEPCNMAHEGVHRKGQLKQPIGGLIDRAAKVKMTDVDFSASPPVAPPSPAYERYEGEHARRRSSLAPAAGGIGEARRVGGQLTRRPLALSPLPLDDGNKQYSPPPSYATSNPNSPLNPNLGSTTSDSTAPRRCSSQLSDVYTADRGHMRLGYLTLVGEEEDVDSKGDENKENPRPTLDDDDEPCREHKP